MEQNRVLTNIGTDPLPGVESSISKIKRQKESLKCLNASKSKDQIRQPLSYSSLRIALPRSESDQDRLFPFNMDTRTVF